MNQSNIHNRSFDFKIIVGQLLFVIGYSGLFFLFALEFDTNRILDLIKFGSGLLVGLSLYVADEKIFSQYYLEKNLEKNGSTQLMSRSATLTLALIPLGVLMLTSTGSYLGVGVYLGIFGALIWHMIILRSNLDQFQHIFLQQMKKKFSSSEVNYYLSFLTFFFLVFSYWVLF